MSCLGSLNVRLTDLNGEKNNIEKKLRIYNERKNDIEILIRNTTEIVDNNYPILNSYISDIISTFPSYLEGVSSVSKIIECISNKGEMSSGYDSKISVALEELREELSKVNSEIDSLDSTLSSLNDRISSTKYYIKCEKLRIVTEKEENYWN